MVLSMMTWRAASKFDAFLQASAGQDPLGMPWSVHSMLARSDLDPLAAAQELTDLPITLATRRLTDIITAQSRQGKSVPEAGTLASGLIGHLPRQGSASAAGRETSPHRGVETSHILVAVALALSVTVAAEYLLVTTHHAPTGDSRDVTVKQQATAAGK